MADEVERLVLAPFREIVEKANTAVENAKNAEGEEAAPMLKAAQNLHKEGERALKRIEPLCAKNIDEYGVNFIDAIKENEEITEYRSELEDLLWDFDDFVEVDAFDADKFDEVQKASRKAAPRVMDILKRMKLEVPEALSTPTAILSPVPITLQSGRSTPVAISMPPNPREDPNLFVTSPPAALGTIREVEAQVPTTMGAQAGPDDGLGIATHGSRSRSASDVDRRIPRRIAMVSRPSEPPLGPPPRPPSADPWHVGNPPLGGSSGRPEDGAWTERRPAAAPGDSPTLPLAGSTEPPQIPMQHPSRRSAGRALENDEYAQREGSHGRPLPSVAHAGPAQNSTNPPGLRSPSRGSNAGHNERFRPDSIAMSIASDASSGKETFRYAGRSSDSASSGSARGSLLLPISPNTDGKLNIPENLTRQSGSSNLGYYPPRQTSLTPGQAQPQSQSQPHTIHEQPSSESVNSSIFDCLLPDGPSSPGANTQRTSSNLSTTQGSPRSPYLPPRYSTVPPMYSSASYTTLKHANPTLVNHAMAAAPSLPPLRSAEPRTPLPPVPRPTVDDPGLIPLATERAEHDLHPPRQQDLTIGPQSSFYQMKGWCKGAEDATRGELGFKRKQRSVGAYQMATVAKCNSCFFELDFNAVEKDLKNDSAGNYMSSHVGFRLRFLHKCHLAMKHVDEPLFGCIFCIHEGSKVEESDATVFFSQKQLFAHLARHPRPFPDIPGFTIVEGDDIPPELRDNFDLHFPEPPVQSIMTGLAREVSKLPTAVTTDTRRNAHGIIRMPPDRATTLQFAVGAKIVGVEFPAKYEGKWALGWHDGVRAVFEADSINLETPPRSEIRMQGMSNIQAVARWKWKQPGEGNWLTFNKGDVIKNISWSYSDHWCWSGTSPKGWGILPQSHIEPDSIRTVSSETSSMASSEKKAGLSLFSIRKKEDHHSKISKSKGSSGKDLSDAKSLHESSSRSMLHDSAKATFLHDSKSLHDVPLSRRSSHSGSSLSEEFGRLMAKQKKGNGLARAISARGGDAWIY